MDNQLEDELCPREKPVLQNKQEILKNDFLCIADKQMEDELPPHAYTNNYGPNFRLHIPVRTGNSKFHIYK